MKVVRVKVEPNWNGNYRLEYDGKYVTLFGADDCRCAWVEPEDILLY